MIETPGTPPAKPAGERTALPANHAAAIETAIGGWLAEHIHNSPLAQATAAYNHLVEKIDALKTCIVAALAEDR